MGGICRIVESQCILVADASRDAAEQMAEATELVGSLADTGIIPEVPVAGDQGAVAIAEWQGLSRLQRTKCCQCFKPSKRIPNWHPNPLLTLLEESKLDRPRQKTVATVAGDLRSEWTAGHECQGNIFVGDIRWDV